MYSSYLCSSSFPCTVMYLWCLMPKTLFLSFQQLSISNYFQMLIDIQWNQKLMFYKDTIIKRHNTHKQGWVTWSFLRSVFDLSKLSYHRQSDTVRRRVGPHSVTPNSCRQTTAAPPYYYWPNGQTETLYGKRQSEKDNFYEVLKEYS